MSYKNVLSLHEEARATTIAQFMYAATELTSGWIKNYAHPVGNF